VGGRQKNLEKKEQFNWKARILPLFTEKTKRKS
jgi:hypothetical protein